MFARKRNKDDEPAYDSVEIFKAEGNYYAMLYHKERRRMGREDWPTFSFDELVSRQKALKKMEESTSLYDKALAEIRARMTRDGDIPPPTLH